MLEAMKPETDFTSMNISLPKAQRAFVEGCVTTYGYGSASEYFRELIRRDEKQRARGELERLLLEGLDSGPAAPFDEKFFERLRERIQRGSKPNGSST